MNELDYRILKHLKENSRIKASVIASRINLSVTAVLERIKKLESSGIIQQYTTVINSKKIGKDLTAFISVGIEHPKYNTGFIEMAKEHDSIFECHYITGDYDFLLKIVVGSSSELENVLNYIKSVKGVSLTRTLVVLSTTKNEITAMPDKENK